jgi:hypothetical protein
MCGSCSTVGGGSGNLINGASDYSNFSTIGGGKANRITCSSHSTIAGGCSNMIMMCYRSSSGNNAQLNTIGGGNYNSIRSYGNFTYVGLSFNTIGGGNTNKIQADVTTYSVFSNTIGGGGGNKIYTSCYSTIGGGFNNIICGSNSSRYNSILGGKYNIITAGYYNVHVIGSNTTGNVNDTTFTENLRVCGALAKTSGTFVIPHPDPSKTDTLDLVHSFVESPTAGDNIYRFKVTIIDGIGEIILPDYYKFLNENTQVWISPINGFGIGYGEINEELTKILITANLDMEYNVLVIGTRKDEHAKKYWKGTERLKPKNKHKKPLT